MISMTRSILIPAGPSVQVRKGYTHLAVVLRRLAENQDEYQPQEPYLRLNCLFLGEPAKKWERG
jgi:hypothetical protein